MEINQGLSLTGERSRSRRARGLNNNKYQNLIMANPAAASSSSRSESMASSSASFSSSTSADRDNSSNNGGNSSSSIPAALPTHEALRVLLSPDGYYEYLGIPKPSSADVDAILGLKYKAAAASGSTSVGGGGGGADGPAASTTTIDLEKVKKNYRRLSLKHHPDRKSGNAEAFRMLNRAKIVLSNSKLRREYDLLGLDLDDDADDDDDDEEEEKDVDGKVEEQEVMEERHQPSQHDNGGDANRDSNNINGEPETTTDGRTSATGAHPRHRRHTASKSNNSGGSRKQQQGNKHTNNSSNNNNNNNNGGGSKTETVMGHLASASLAAVLQVVVRTGLMGMVSTLISRYTILVSRYSLILFHHFASLLCVHYDWDDWWGGDGYHFCQQIDYTSLTSAFFSASLSLSRTHTHKSKFLGYHYSKQHLKTNIS